jgi:hypothetical protein
MIVEGKQPVQVIRPVNGRLWQRSAGMARRALGRAGQGGSQPALSHARNRSSLMRSLGSSVASYVRGDTEAWLQGKLAIPITVSGRQRAWA